MLGFKIDFTKHQFAVIGLGETGASIIAYLNYCKAKLIKVFDTRLNPPYLKAIGTLPLHLGDLKYSLFADIDIIVISPGISIYEPVLQQCIYQGKLVIGDIELFALAIYTWNSKVIGITGSNGKTTVTALTGYLAQKCGINTLIAGNIGTPVLTSYLDIMEKGQLPDLIVLELSSFQLESTYNLSLDAAVVLNISEDHLDRYRDLLEYAYVKANIFNHCRMQVLNREDDLVAAMARANIPTIWFGLSQANQFSLKQLNNVTYLQLEQQTLLNVKDLSLVGMHNYLNCLASLALLKAIGVDVTLSAIKEGLCQFQGLEHRMQKVTTHNGVLYIEDSKGTNVGAVVAGVSGLDRPVHLILGGDGKGQDFMPLRNLVQNKCKSVAIIGQDKVAIQQVLVGLSIPIQTFSSLEEAVKFCIANAQEGEAVVLSPACASWDMFDNYKHRAKVFIDSIYEHIN